jgi:hypothetical protein
MVMPCLGQLVAGLSSQRPDFMPESVHVGFVVYKVELGQDFLPFLQFSPVLFQHGCTLIYHPGHENRPAAGCSLEIQSHLIDMNNKGGKC